MTVLAVCPAPPAYAVPAPDRPRYALTVHWTRRHDVVDGRLVLAFTPNRSTSRLYLRLWPNAPYTRRRGARLTVYAVRVDGARASTALRDPTTLVIRRAAHAGERARISLRWRLVLPKSLAGRLSQRGRTLQLASFFPLLPWDPDRGWILDPPSTSIAEAWTSPTADFDVRISAPRGDTILASGARAGTRRWRGTAIRDFALAAGRFRTVRAVVHAPRPVRVTVGVEPGGDAPSPSTFLRRVERALVELSRRYGPYPWSTYTLAVPRAVGASGIEYPTLIFQGPRSLRIATTHEAAHQWFYSLVGNDQARDPWLDESLATWAAGQIDGSREYFVGFRLPPAAKGHLGSSMRYWDKHMNAYFAGIYAQGVRALASLGPPADVDCALRLYVARHAYGIARPRDLVDALEEVLPGATDKLRAYGVG
jgi:hypothetical protein